MTHITLSDSSKLSYLLDDSPADAPVILLSNSLAAPFKVWDHVVAFLNDNGFRTLRYDQPGHGESEARKPLTDTTFDSITDDVKSLLDSLNIHKVHGWIGDSMGAASGVLFTTKFPGVVERLAICDTIDSSPGNAGTEDLFGARVAAARADGNMSKTLQGSMERWFSKAWMEANPEETERIRSIMHTTTIDGFEACCSALSSNTFDLRPLYGKVGASVDKAICIVGENDGPLPGTMKVMRDKVQEGFEASGKSQNVELAIIKNAGHVPFLDNRSEFCDVIVRFMKD